MSIEGVEGKKSIYGGQDTLDETDGINANICDWEEKRRQGEKYEA